MADETVPIRAAAPKATGGFLPPPSAAPHQCEEYESPWPPWIAVMVIWLSMAGASAAMFAWLPLEALADGYGLVLVVGYICAAYATVKM